MPERISGTDANSLGNEIRSGRVKHNDVLMLTYDNGDILETLYKEGAPYLIGANDAPVDVQRRRTFARGCARDDFVSWERKGSYDELYRK